MLNKVILNEYELYKSGFSIPDVSKKTGIPRSTLRFRFLSAGILRSRNEGVQKAKTQGKLGSGNRGKHRTFSEKWKNNIKTARLRYGEKNSKGITLKPSGYLEITRGPHKGRPHHDVVMEDNIGRPLEKEECVHHMNGDKSDNRIINLKLMKKGEHSRLHALNRNITRNEMGRFV